MTESEKARIRGSIQSYMLKHPAYTPSPIWSVFFMRPAVAGLAGLVILLGSGAGLSFASQESLPNESLYPIKILQEDIVSLTKTTPKEKADYGIVRVEKRIQEATVLAKTNKLEPEMKQKIADTIAKHVEEVESQTRVVEKVSPEIALETTTKLETSLETNVKALEALTSPEEKSEDPILVIVETKAEDAHITKTETEITVQENPSEDIRIKAEGKLITIKGEIQHIGAVSIEPVTPPASPEVITETKPIEISTLTEDAPIENIQKIIDTSPTLSTAVQVSTSSQDRVLPKEDTGIIPSPEIENAIPIISTTAITPIVEIKTEPTRDLFMSELVRLYTAAEQSFNLGNYGEALVALQSIEQMIQSQKTISTLEQTYQVEIPTQLIEVPALSTELSTEDAVGEKIVITE